MDWFKKDRKLIKFEDYIDTVWLVFDFKGPPDQPIRYISDKNRNRLQVMTILYAYEFIKLLYHAIWDNDLHRLYLCDLVSIIFKFWRASHWQ